MPRGGARPNSGPKKGTKFAKTLDKEAAREALREMVKASLRPMVEAQIAAATGVKYLVGRARKGGKFKHLTAEQVQAILSGEDSEYEVLELWEKPPSTQAFQDLLDRTLDRPSQHVAVDGAAKIEISWKSSE